MDNIVDNGDTMAGGRCKILLAVPRRYSANEGSWMCCTRGVQTCRARFIRGVWTNKPSIFCNKIVVRYLFREDFVCKTIYFKVRLGPLWSVLSRCLEGRTQPRSHHQRPSVLAAEVAHPHSPPPRTAPSFPTASPVVPRTSSSSRPP